MCLNLKKISFWIFMRIIQPRKFRFKKYEWKNQKAYKKLKTKIDKILNVIYICKKEINNYDEQIIMKNNQADSANRAGNNLINDLNYKIQTLQNNISSLENQKYEEENNFEKIKN